MPAHELGFIPIDVACVALVTKDAAQLDAQHGIDSRAVRDNLASVIAMTPARIVAGGEWGTFLAFDRSSRVLIGACGFTSAPKDNRCVEIAYFTFPPNEGQGYATAMAEALVRHARKLDHTVTVIAHTLPETNASTRVLEKNAFRRDGEAIDPDDGPVWRWKHAPLA